MHSEGLAYIKYGFQAQKYSLGADRNNYFPSSLKMGILLEGLGKKQETVFPEHLLKQRPGEQQNG